MRSVRSRTKRVCRGKGQRPIFVFALTTGIVYTRIYLDAYDSTDHDRYIFAKGPHGFFVIAV